ncbi:unnamed protein product [Echinostoma caproni]|uniref:SCP domain-containing protein n=1 Tax=Echinostoma caproni TaxID=27848 RepID=A0A183AGK8_9TREM|nr:unnamed protein product [Echinostoma caproni]
MPIHRSQLIEEARAACKQQGDSSSEARGVAGAGIALSDKAECSLLDWISVNSRLCAVRLDGSVWVNSCYVLI